MLTTLRIKNLALVADLTLELQAGCNVITGETGAGKSIVIGALSLVLGERADRTLIRSGSDSCSVEAVFDISRLRAPLRTYLDENGLEPCEGNQLVLKRSFTVGGTNRQFVNGSPTTLNILAALGEWLVDLHGPHDHQSLLQPSKQLAILDAYGGLETERNAFAQRVRRRSALEAEKSALIVDEKTYAQQLDLLRFQGKEIEAAKLQADEESLVEQEFNRASNSAKLLQLGQTALDLLSESDNALLSQAGSIGRTLQELHRVDASARNLTQLHEQAVSTLRDLQSEISRYVEKVDVDPARLAELEERLNLIHTLKRKYGVTLAEVIAFGEDAKQKLASLETRDAELARLHAALAEIDAQISKAGKSLSVARKKVIPQLAKAAAKQLAHLGFKQSKFDVAITTAEAVSPPSPPDEGRRRGPGRGGADQNSPLSDSLPTHSSQGESDPTAGVRGLSFSSTGFDTIEFQFSPNVGEPLKPLRAIASSGEMARVMLALKTVLAAQDEIPLLVFDEVDANVGGETANAVGEKMKQLASNRQVLCITHLPQVAAPADAHYVVTKQVKDGRTISEITLLDKKSRVIELARMLGGQSDAARRHAEALLR